VSQITVDTPTNLVVGAGDFYKDQAGMGATMGDNQFSITREIFTPELNGAKGKLLGTDYVKTSTGMLSVTLAEVSAATLATAWPGSTSRSETSLGASTTTIDEDNTRRIPTAAYADYELQVERLDGGEIQFEVDDAIHTASLEGTLGDGSNFGMKLQMESRWDPADLSRSPHRIRLLAAAS